MTPTVETYRAAAERLEDLGYDADLPSECWYETKNTAELWAAECRGAAEALEHHQDRVLLVDDPHQSCEEIADNYRQLCQSVWEYLQDKGAGSVFTQRSLENLKACARDLNIL